MLIKYLNIMFKIYILPCGKHSAMEANTFSIYSVLTLVDGVGLFTVYFIFRQKYLYNKYSLIYISIYVNQY